jgi:hypothetical protein
MIKPRYSGEVLGSSNTGSEYAPIAGGCNNYFSLAKTNPGG